MRLGILLGISDGLDDGMRLGLDDGILLGVMSRHASTLTLSIPVVEVKGAE